MKFSRSAVIALLAACLWTSTASAKVTLLLEEPYSLDGAFGGGGHVAVYLSNVCASSPTVLRHCEAGETGVVISRYVKVAGFDWLAIPLIPYLYAVEEPSQVPLIADKGIVASLRDRYRQKFLRDLIPDSPTGEIPTGNWYQLAGSAYDRTLYGFQVDSTPEMDDAFISAFNDRSNQSVYNYFVRNCANFSRDVVNFYYPKAVGSASLSDLKINSPRHAAKTFSSFMRRHPELHPATLVIPQIPGCKRSTRVHGVIEGLMGSKKYFFPMLFFTPEFTIGAGAMHLFFDRFNPARNAMVLRPDGALEPPVENASRRIHEKELKKFARKGIEWEKFRRSAQVHFDSAGRPFLRSTVDGEVLEVGITRGNLFAFPDSGLAREVLLAHLAARVRKSHAPSSSDEELRETMALLPTDAHTSYGGGS